MLKLLSSLLVVLGIIFGVASDAAAYTYYPSNSYYYGGYYSNPYYLQTSSVYPGCSGADILIGGQIWASCNALSKNIGSTEKSGWFFAKDLKSSFVSYNGIGAPLEWKGKATSTNSWFQGPCAKGYRLPTRGDWETVIYYARLNGTSVTNLINLPKNGGFRGYKDSDGDIRIEGQQDVLGSYWTNSFEYSNNTYTPVVMRINGTYQNYRVDGTYYSDTTTGYEWQYGETGLSLVSGTYSDLANVRCIKN